jgi:hypothetical protein
MPCPAASLATSVPFLRQIRPYEVSNSVAGFGSDFGLKLRCAGLGWHTTDR